MTRLLLAAAIVVGCAWPAQAQFDGPRIYWPLPQRMNIVTGQLLTGIANASWEAWNRVNAEADARNSLFLATYSRNQPLFDRSVHWLVVLPVGVIDLDTPSPVSRSRTFAHGVGDISFGGTVNLYGAPGMTLAEFLQSDVGFSANVGLMFTAPSGQYDEAEVLNIGANQWRTRLSAPVVWSISDWVPGRRTTVEVMPAVTFIGDNENNRGLRIDQDSIFALETHLTRDLTERAFASLDYSWIGGGAQTLVSSENDVVVAEQGEIDTHLLGLTLGFEVNDNLRLNVSHMQTLSGSAADGAVPLSGALTRVSFIWAWHPVGEAIRRLQGD